MFSAKIVSLPRPQRAIVIFGIVLLALSFLTSCMTQGLPPKIGVVYLVHGGSDDHSDESSWNATMQIFAYDPHSTVYKQVIWNPKIWPRMLSFGNAPKEKGKYSFEHRRIGRPDPANSLTRLRYQHLRDSLERREAELGVDFVVDYASWLAIEDPSHHVYPRWLYHPGVTGGTPLTYCGSTADGGIGPNNQWPGCDPERYDTDGSIERLLDQDVDEIVVIDMTVSGVRFFKSWDAVNLARQVVANYNAANNKRVALWWANDPTDLMTESYPRDPAGWTLSLGPPKRDRSIPLDGRPNPVSADPRLANFHVDGIAARFADDIDPAATGVMLVNHATRNHNQHFDPKIDDTVILNQNIKRALLARYPTMSSENIVGSWMGRKIENPNIEPKPPNFSQLERSREMRGENLGDAWLYETNEQMPAGEWGYRYWEALDHLKNRGVKHIVIAFPQIMVDSVLNLVEVPNQMAKELGYKNWSRYAQRDFDSYPGVGHPFADYWGVWVNTNCALPEQPEETGPCCFEMGGCADGRPYPPRRQTPQNKARGDLDPSLAYDVSAFGHLGYDASRGPVNPDQAVQEQYRGSWDLWVPPNDKPEVGEFLADKVVEFLQQPRPRTPVEAVLLGD